MKIILIGIMILIVVAIALLLTVIAEKFFDRSEDE